MTDTLDHALAAPSGNALVAPDYDQQLAELEAEILRLTALRNGQEPGSPTHTIYQDRITAHTRVLLALEVSLDDLRAADIRLARAQWALNRVQGIADRDMETTWRTVMISGAIGAVGLVITGVWSGPPWWLPTGAVAALGTAVLVLVLGLRRRPARYEPVDAARRDRDTARTERAALGQRVANGQIAVPTTAPAAKPNTSWPHTL